MNPYIIAAVLLAFCGYTVGVYEYGVHHERLAIAAASTKTQLNEEKREGQINVDVATHVGDNTVKLESEKADVHQKIEAAVGCPAVAVQRMRRTASVQPAGAPSEHHASASADVAVSVDQGGDQPSRGGQDAQVTAAVINANLDAGAANTVSCAGLQEWAARICADGRCGKPPD